MDFFELVDKRRSVRKFSNETIPEKVIIKALIYPLKLQDLLIHMDQDNLQEQLFQL